MTLIACGDSVEATSSSFLILHHEIILVAKTLCRPCTHPPRLRVSEERLGTYSMTETAGVHKLGINMAVENSSQNACTMLSQRIIVCAGLDQSNVQNAAQLSFCQSLRPCNLSFNLQMGICDFDYNVLFCDLDWDGEWRSHHIDPKAWAESVVRDACPICMILWQNLRQAVQRTRLAETSNQAIETRSLLTDESEEALCATLKSIITSWPFYRVRLRELTADDYSLAFHQVRDDLAKNNNDLNIPIQNFIVYPVESTLGPRSLDALINNLSGIRQWPIKLHWQEHGQPTKF